MAGLTMVWLIDEANMPINRPKYAHRILLKSNAASSDVVLVTARNLRRCGAQADGSGGPGPPLPHDWVQLVSVCCVLCTHFCHPGPQSLRRWKPPSTLMTSPVE